MRPGLYAFATAAGFVGAATYICLIEQPARLKLSGGAMVQEWRQSYHRGTMMMSVLAAVSAILAFIQFKMHGDVRWIIGGTTILATLPYSYFVMTPVNIWLWAIAPGRAASPVRNLMLDWGALEWGQVLLGFGAACAFAWALELPVC